jgi:hypothetical protein
VHAAITSIAVVITANHYWLDGVIAVGMVVVAAAIVRRRVVMDEQSYELVSGATQWTASASPTRCTTGTPG